MPRTALRHAPQAQILRMRPLALLRALVRRPLQFLEATARTHGDLVEIQVGSRRIVFASHPELVRAVLVEHADDLAKGRVLERARRVLGDGLLTSEGALHQRQRRLVAPAFHRERVATAATVMAKTTAQTATSWPQTIDATREMARLTLKIVAKALFSIDVDDTKSTEVAKALDDLLGSFGLLLAPLSDLLLWLPLPASRRVRSATHTLDSIIAGMIDQRHREGDLGDLLSMLVASRDEDGTPMDTTLVRDEALTLLLAGHETTANALSWALWLLDRHPAVRARLEAEVDELGRIPTFDDLPRLPWTRAVFEETLRLYPPAWAIGRTATRDFELGGHCVTTGSAVVVSQWVVHRDSRFFADPDSFAPQRFLPGQTPGPRRDAFFPFGLGPRTCIGMAFAMAEGVLLLATLARLVRLECVAPVDAIPNPGLTLRLSPGLPMRVVPRHN